MQASGRERQSTQVSPLSLDVRAGFGAGQKTEPYRTKAAVFPKTEPKPTDLGHCEHNTNTNV